MKFLIVGLGNIGSEYEHTRHNIGFDVVAAFVQKHNGVFTSDRLVYRSNVKWRGKNFICICPTTYMNLSGKAVKYWIDKEKIPLERIFVIMDDLSIPINKIRIRPSGSAGGHNGLSSIQESLLSTDYSRMRFGIGNDYPKGRQADFVLSKWSQEEAPLVKMKIEAAVSAIEVFALQGVATAMNLINNKEFTLQQ